MLKIWHIQIAFTEWVFWGYGPKPSAIIHVAMANTNIPIDNCGNLIIPFQLPRYNPVLPFPLEYERKTGWAFRIVTNDYIHDTGWEYVDSLSKEDVLKHAFEKVDKLFDPKRGYSEDFSVAVKSDIREITKG